VITVVIRIRRDCDRSSLDVAGTGVVTGVAVPDDDRRYQYPSARTETTG
jgi:hypothetical protein